MLEVLNNEDKEDPAYIKPALPGGLFKDEGPSLDPEDNDDKDKHPELPRNKFNVDKEDFHKIKGLEKKQQGGEIKHRIVEVWPIDGGNACAIRFNKKITKPDGKDAQTITEIIIIQRLDNKDAEPLVEKTFEGESHQRPWTIVVWRPTDPHNVYFLTKRLHKEENKPSFTKGGKEDEVNLMLMISMYTLKEVVP